MGRVRTRLWRLLLIPVVLAVLVLAVDLAIPHNGTLCDPGPVPAWWEGAETGCVTLPHLVEYLWPPHWFSKTVCVGIGCPLAPGP